MTGDLMVYGVHAWPAMQGVMDYVGEWLNDHGNMLRRPGAYVVGRVALWGEVIEHERGYRAEFAKITAIEFVLERHPIRWEERMEYLRQLRATYLPEEKKKSA